MVRTRPTVNILYEEHVYARNQRSPKQATLDLAVYGSKWAFWSLIFVCSDANRELQRGRTAKV